jgi:hypothetical protein
MVFINDDKPSDKAPDMSGVINVEGDQYRIAMWLNQGEGGKADYYGVSVSPAEENAPAPARGRSNPASSGRSSSSSGNSGGGQKTFSKPNRR